MKLDQQDARGRFAAAEIARLATSGEDRQPHVVPVTFAADADDVFIAIDHKPKTTQNLRRLRNIEANPLVSVLVDHYTADWEGLWWVRADGTARIFQDDSPRTRALDLLAYKYPQYRDRRPTGPIIAIRVTRWSGWSYA